MHHSIQEVAELKRTLNRLVGVLFFCCLLLFGYSTPALADSGGSQIITVTVPCTVRLEIGNHGSVTVDGTKYTGNASFQKDLESLVTYTITPDSGYEISEVTYDGKDVTASAKSGTYNATALTGNVTLKVTFVKKAGTPTDPTSLKTGDESHTVLWIGLMCVSGIALAAMLIGSRKRNVRN